jgi:hypothetical protein
MTPIKQKVHLVLVLSLPLVNRGLIRQHHGSSYLIPRFMLVPENVGWSSLHINPQVLPCLALLQTASEITYLLASRKSRVINGHELRLERGSQLAKEKIIIINLFIIYVDHLNTKCTSNCLIFQVLSFPAPRLS